MGFGQPSGPPASAERIRHLLALLNEAGHTDFRDARGPMGFTQRQAAGKFTRDEADAFIEQLEATVHGEPPPPSRQPTARQPAVRQPAVRATAAERSVRDMPSGILAAELQRRGWIVVEP